MIANYHTHTKRCRHAQGEDEEYVLAALDRGLEILGFSDHTPYPFPNGYYSTFRMLPEQLEDYVNSVICLREKYAGKLKILLGLEAEYYPALFPELQQMLKDQPIDYLLLGQHTLGNEENDHASGSPTEDEHLLRRYVNQTMEAMNTGCFAYFAHPDLFRFEGDPKVYCRYMRQLIREAKSCNMPLEFNLAGMHSGAHYPKRLFWEIVAEEGATAIKGVDAHSPEFLRDKNVDEEAKTWLEGLDILFIESLQL